VPIRRSGKKDEWRFAVEIVELPPIVWDVFEQWVCAVG
jgi:hypothetical protein